jgi:hypothetical protein
MFNNDNGNRNFIKEAVTNAKGANNTEHDLRDFMTVASKLAAEIMQKESKGIELTTVEEDFIKGFIEFHLSLFKNMINNKAL